MEAKKRCVGIVLERRQSVDRRNPKARFGGPQANLGNGTEANNSVAKAEAKENEKPNQRKTMKKKKPAVKKEVKKSGHGEKGRWESRRQKRALPSERPSAKRTIAA